MPMNKAILAAYRAATRIRPDIKEFYKAQRAAEDLSAKLAMPNPRCRVDDAFARACPAESARAAGCGRGRRRARGRLRGPLETCTFRAAMTYLRAAGADSPRALL